MEKLYFNTGVRPENRLNSKGKMIELSEFEEWRGGVLQVAFYISDIPKNGNFKFASSNLEENLKTHKSPYWEYRKIIKGGLLSNYAFFQIYPIEKEGKQ
jgi:hypothetical protein